jgi:hypothetical protein
MKKLSILIALFPLNALAHPGHVELTTATTLGLLIVSGIGALALHQAVNYARARIKDK